MFKHITSAADTVFVLGFILQSSGGVRDEPASSKPKSSLLGPDGTIPRSWPSCRGAEISEGSDKSDESTSLRPKSSRAAIARTIDGPSLILGQLSDSAERRVRQAKKAITSATEDYICQRGTQQLILNTSSFEMSRSVIFVGLLQEWH